MTIPKAHITWAATALAGSFGYYSVERYNELLRTLGVATPGWQPIGKVTAEATTSFDDYEGRFGVAESYRVQVYDTFGGPSVPVAATVHTKTSSTRDAVLVSNESPAGNLAISFETLQVGLPERSLVAAAAGRYGQRHYRSSDNLGETLSLNLDLFDAEGADLWRSVVSRLRADLPYLCLLDAFGDRWFVGASPSGVTSPKFDYAQLAVELVEVTDTPSIVVV